MVLMIIFSVFFLILIDSPITQSQDVSHDPISIHGDEEFILQAENEGWPGEGTEDNPYIIGGYWIIASDVTGIYITGTSLYFEIIDTIITGGRRDNGGIFFRSVSNGMINGCTIMDNEYGIRIVSSNDNIITNNALISNREQGIHLSASSDHIITDNEMIENGIVIWGNPAEEWDSHQIDSSNTVNGNPIYFWKNQNGGTIPAGAGQVILTNCENVTIENQTNIYSIDLAWSSNNTIINNNLNMLGDHSIHLFYSERNNIENNTITNDRIGIDMLCSAENVIIGNTMIGCGFFIDFGWLEHWTTNIIDTTNTVNGRPVYFLKNQTGAIVPSSAGQVILANCSNVIVENLELSDTSIGIQLGYSHNNVIRNNNVSDNWHGMYFMLSSENNVTGNIISNNENCINLQHSNNNNFDNNTISFNNRTAITLLDSNQNVFTNNIMVSNVISAIRSYHSDGSVITGNNISYNGNGIWFFNSGGANISYNNFFSNEREGIYIGRLGGHHIAGNTVSHNRWGIWIEQLDDTAVVGNVVHSNEECGIDIRRSNRNTVSDNIVYNNGDGIRLWAASHNSEIHENTLSDNWCGINLGNSSQNNIVNNNVSNNRFGFRMDDSCVNNTLHHNDIIDNELQLSDSGASNIWDDGQGEGNYWSDYTGVDRDDDGVGETDVPHLDVDNFPLTDKNPSSSQEEPRFLSFLLLLVLIVIIIIVTIVLKRKGPKKQADSRAKGISPK